MSGCPCGNAHGYDWHKARDLPMCQYVKDRRKEKDKKRTRGGRRISWTPGSSIRVPEFDPL